MLLLNVLLVPLIGLPVLGLIRKKFYRDAAIYGAVSLLGYVLWFTVVRHRPFVITVFMEKVFKMFM